MKYLVKFESDCQGEQITTIGLVNSIHGDDEYVSSGKYLSVSSIDPVDGSVWSGWLGKALDQYTLIPIDEVSWEIHTEIMEKLEEK